MRMQGRTAWSLTLSSLVIGGVTPRRADSSLPGYEYTCVGGCDTPAGTRAPRGGVVMAGGSTDVDDGFRWMSAQADGGNFLVLRATGTGAYNQYIYDMGGVHSAATIVLREPAAADDDFVTEKIHSAHAIFFAGGNQWNYFGGWSGSRLQAAVQAAINDRHVPVGGTSAGLAILGEYVFTAKFGGVTSAEALGDPFVPSVAIAERPFLNVPFLSNLITDQHFRERDRMGRALTFMARISHRRTSGGPTIKAICVDERTSLLVDTQTGQATAVGTGTGGGFHGVYFMRNLDWPERVEPGVPLGYLATRVQRIDPSGPAVFNLNSWTCTGCEVDYRLDVLNGTVSSDDPSGGIYGPPPSSTRSSL